MEVNMANSLFKKTGDDVFSVSEGVLGRCGPRFQPFNISRLEEKHGVDVVISLQKISKRIIQAFRDVGIRHEKLFFPSGELENTNQRERFINDALQPAIEIIKQERKKGNTVLVHCTAGLDRTGSVLAGWLIENRGMEPDEAIQQIKDNREDAFITDGYEEAVFLWWAKKDI
jgi:protein-tyrosine phosphatase